MATAKKKNEIPEEVIKSYDAIIATVPGLERKGAAIPYTSLNGHMFSFLMPDGLLALRLPEDEIEPFLKQYKTEHPKQYGIVQTKYVLVPGGLLKDTKKLKPYFSSSYKYISGLKAKPTTKSKKAAKK